ncbi:MAG: site-specific integrase [Candidatus Methanofastidiosa archaeon]|nr:site-specific integrase [Candidatus Methanofastidiosa archaeon]
MEEFYIDYLKGDYSKSTIRNLAFAINHYAEYKGYDLKIKPPKKNMTEVKYLNREDIITVLDHMPNYRETAIFLLMVQAGLRINEVCKLNIEDLYLKDDYILLKDTKNRKDWKVYITEEIKTVILVYITNERPPSNNKAVFINSNNSRLSNRFIEKRFEIIREKSNIYFYPHMLRHTCATQMRINGADIDTIKNQLRHQDYKSTQRYIHAIDEVQKINYLKYCPKILK